MKRNSTMDDKELNQWQLEIIKILDDLLESIKFLGNSASHHNEMFKGIDDRLRVLEGRPR